MRNWYWNSASAERFTSVHYTSLCENWRWNFKFTAIFDLFSSRKEGKFSSSRLSRAPKKYELEIFHYFFSVTTSNRHLCCINKDSINHLSPLYIEFNLFCYITQKKSSFLTKKFLKNEREVQSRKFQVWLRFFGPANSVSTIKMNSEKIFWICPTLLWRIQQCLLQRRRDEFDHAWSRCTSSAGE